MFTTGSKLLIGSAVLATVLTVAYGVTVGGTLGTIGLASAAASLAFLAGMVIYTRDANVGVDDTGATTVSAAAQQAPPGSIWPIVAVGGITMVLVGIVTYPTVVVIGLVLLLAGTAEWMVQAWAERGSADAAYNDEIRARIANPLEMPVIGVLVAAVVIYGFSRVMLNLSKVGTVVAFSVLAAVVLFVAFLLAARPKVSGTTIGGVVAVGLFAMIAGGAAAGLSGERDMHVIETTADLAERGRCGTEPTEADERNSQTVGAKSNQSATVTLNADGSLSFTQPGFQESTRVLTLPRSNPNNILFRNASDHERRLVVDVGPTGDSEENRQACTALVEPGAVQLLTLVFDRPSFAIEDGLFMTVPGVDTAVLEVRVP